jgi:hypothetical protein
MEDYKIIGEEYDYSIGGKAKNNLQSWRSARKMFLLRVLLKLIKTSNYNSRRNNMDFGTCFVVVLVVILYVVAWLDDQSKRK